MGLANIKNTIVDGQLGSSGGSSEGVFGVVGIGCENTESLVILSSSEDLQKLPDGELKETLKDVYECSSPRMYALAIKPSTESITSTITHNISGGGSVRVHGVANNRFSIFGGITKAGTLGSARITLSINGIEQKPCTIPKDGEVIIPESGLTLQFSADEQNEPFALDDSFSFTTTLPKVSNEELLTAVEKLLDSKLSFEAVAVATETDKSFWAMLSVSARNAFETFLYIYFITKAVSKKTESLDEYVQALIGEQRGSVNDYRVSVCAGDFLVGNKGFQKSILGKYIGTLAARKIHQAPDAVKFGNIPLEEALLFENDTALEMLEEAGFVTARKITGLTGIYITSGRMLIDVSSDYKTVERVRVMNEACSQVRKVQLEYLNDNIELGVDGSLVGIQMFKKKSELPLEKMIGDKVISDAEVIIPSEQNILSSETLTTKIKIVPLGKMKFIENEIAYKNPVLA